ncbi:MAG: sigma-70 family RNA polymerase sigma factor [Planctomycetes bacterium]|nr:sigma-70 family RNA polymerase sigma factor [Planctomycetota bacterium]
MPQSTSIQVADLLQKARAGDESARERLFAACRNYVEILARAEMASWLKAKVDASDLVQQSLLDAHRGLDRFRGSTEAEWLGWLRRIVTNNAADYVRQYHAVEKRRAGREVPLADSASETPHWQLAADAPTPSQILLQKERQLQIADAIVRLPPDYQEVVVLRDLQQLSFEEVAERMGRSRPAVQMLWARAIQKLQKELTGPESNHASG